MTILYYFEAKLTTDNLNYLLVVSPTHITYKDL